MKRKTLLIGLSAVSALVALDQISKALIRTFVGEGDENAIVLIPSFLQINHHWNEGAAWGMLPGATSFFIVVTLIALGVFGYLFWDADFQKKRVYSIGITLLIAGTIGNFIDRIAFAAVLDFIDFVIPLLRYDFPIFNVADICLTIGMTLFLVDILFFEKARQTEDVGE